MSRSDFAEIFNEQFRTGSHDNLQTSLSYLARTFEANIYVESPNGSLLFTAGKHPIDAWRSNLTPFSPPNGDDYPAALQGVSVLPGKYQSHCVATPNQTHIFYSLTFRNELFAFVHMVLSPNPKHTEDLLHPTVVSAICDKVYSTLIGDISALNASPDLVQDEYLNSSHDIQSYLLGTFTLHEEIPKETPSILPAKSIMKWHITNLIGQTAMSRNSKVGMPLFLNGTSIEHGQSVFLLPVDDKASPAATAQELASEIETNGPASHWNFTLRLLSGIDTKSPVEHAKHLIPSYLVAPELPSSGAKSIDLEQVLEKLSSLIDSYHMPGLAILEKRIRIALASEPVLRSTLSSFLNNSCNTTQTAKELYVDRRTINYRLQRLSTLTQFNLREYRDSALVYLALCTSASYWELSV
ncbi:helix-turn-helix domain-containing protein [Corynebacterium coyleae]|uniref:helix-turn-helix domain-containing protein n=1 Tax=Corynebacterium coyleae TaxID=53374 RepID=UPI00254D605F|nr:helix-turn-helix domain-containing protein [Corynebacterium coyleae]MDK6493120.1 helix-turn-helix domain-containing protein [Corynebacterium coyleae]